MNHEEGELTAVWVDESHRDAWERLYEDYAVFYGVEQTPAMRARVWAWLMDPAHELQGLIATEAVTGKCVGFAHFRPYTRPLAATVGGFLDDLFVTREARGSGAAQVLIRRVADVGRERNWSLIRWITRENNYRARAVYDRLATRTDWVTYDLTLE